MAEGAGEAIPKELQTVLDNLTKDGDIVQVLKILLNNWAIKFLPN